MADEPLRGPLSLEPSDGAGRRWKALRRAACWLLGHVDRADVELRVVQSPKEIDVSKLYLLGPNGVLDYLRLIGNPVYAVHEIERCGRCGRTAPR